MDIFMDKLAQSHNAQQIIRANTAAEVEELDKLRNRVAEYNECLDRLKNLVAENADGLRGAARENTAEISRLVEESLGKIREIQQDSAELEKLSGQLEKMNGRMDNVTSQVDSVNGLLGACLADLGDVKGALSDKLDRLSRQVEENASAKPGDKLEEKFAIADENVHKECVKVYRNVQAVIMEESGKQGEALKENSGKLTAVKGKLGVVLGISIAALVLSLTGTVLQLLQLLGVSPL